MLKNRVVNIAEGPWGKATIYSNEPEVKKPKEPEPEKPITIIMEGKCSETSELTVEHDIGPEKDDDIDIYRLPYFEASLFATILEDTITELRILVECNTEMRITKLQSDMGLLLALKYGVKQPAVTDELDGIDPKRLDCNEYKLNKLDADRKYLADVLLTSYMDLSLNKTYRTLAMHVKKIVDRDNYRADLQEAEAKNRVLRREMNRQLRQQRNHIKSVTYDTDVIIDNLRTNVEDSTLNAEICGRYVANWERARTEQHIQTIHDKEYSPSQAIEYYKQRMDHEQRVHTEVELLINIAINIEDRDKLMKDWIHFKEEREKARLYREKMNNCAITVQAWWRGLLVRRQLGPFKPAKKPPKKK